MSISPSPEHPSETPDAPDEHPAASTFTAPPAATTEAGSPADPVHEAEGTTTPSHEAAGVPSGETQAPPTPQKASWSFFSTHPVLTVAQPMPPSVLSGTFNAMAWTPWLILTLLLTAQCLFSLDARELWYSDEIRHADAFRNLLLHNDWLVLKMNGQPYPDKPPLYFWFLRALYDIPSLREGYRLYFAGAALSALLYLWSFLLLGRLVTRADGRSLLAGGIALMSCGYLVGLAHYSRMDLLFAAVIVCAHTAFYHAWIRRRSFLLMGLAFALAGAACLIKGPLGIALPLGASLLFLLWRGTPLRIFRADLFFGLLVLLCIIGAWAGAVYQLAGREYLVDLVFRHQLLERAVDTFHHKQPWTYYLVSLPLMLLPWTLLILCLPWTRLFSRETWKGVAATRNAAEEGLAYAWCIALSALILLSCLSGKIHIYLLPALPAFAILMGRAILGLSGGRALLFRHLTAFFLLLCGCACIAGTLMLAGDLPVPHIQGLPAWELPTNSGFFIVAFIFVATAAFIWFVPRISRPEGVLLAVAVMFACMAYPLANMVAPAFDAVLSPRATALKMLPFINAGYTPVSYDDYGGTFSFYTGHTITEIPKKRRDVLAGLLTQPKVVLAVKRSQWEQWQEKPTDMAQVGGQWIETREYLLLARPVNPDGSPVQEGGSPAQAETPPAPASASVPDTMNENSLPAVQAETPPAMEAPEASPSPDAKE